MFYGKVPDTLHQHCVRDFFFIHECMGRDMESIGESRMNGENGKACRGGQG